MINFSLMILAAGFGKRMKSLTENTPKPLLKVHNKTLLGNTIDFFEKLGCNHFVINTHYLHKKLKDYLNENYSKKNINIIFEPHILDTGGGVKNAIKFFDKKNFLVTNADILWKDNNANDVKVFIDNINHIQNCCLLLSKKTKTIGITKRNGDFAFAKKNIRRWKINDPLIFYSGLQIINPVIFENYSIEKFSINEIWDELIIKKKLEGCIMNSNLFHLGDINTYNTIKDNLTLD
ncbi:MAG: D-glycero-alpha-D-manno-heptose 1-phosphate guanylyltransferase [Alphaproteobacteria bacterium MarineAlpha5_Bin8]|nr:MAG: D-glycero-alpha-D-manno-heptose 1-phosphate guanylyltransferase [Alphaproteobacteria bacterium MarineAlpha5_Bin7]PPR46311.1 MAG: D-glycero-alpha-D-manno-heptose 1-phosphate guanylyltransferase [Alphaproteobacteria bacterium MarineAlpha5_Bin8]PPR54978.1 MAG: D-glycero-alpha-D-manno-heptose 1-phosphate guanylyltransferase [Alphaproteobacteria bacterium MarineAlpha5_Bin6]|tara:strand:- start:2817 stop:3521 length:705 start_codon:yes stop_codon:yes gene_type:complete